MPNKNDLKNVETSFIAAEKNNTPNVETQQAASLPNNAQQEARLIASLQEHFPDLVYRDVKGLCKAETIEEIETQGWSLNLGTL